MHASKPPNSSCTGMPPIMHKTRIVSALAGLTLLIVPAAGRAEPYEIYARFRPLQKDGKAIEIPIDTKAAQVAASGGADARDHNIFPDQSSDHVLTGIYVRLKKDDISKSGLANLRDLVFYREINGAEEYIDKIDLSKPPERDLLLIDTAHPSLKNGQLVKLRVRSKPTPAYLCAQETELRKSWKAIDNYPQSAAEYLTSLAPSGPPAAPPAPAKAGQAAPAPKAAPAAPATPPTLDLARMNDADIQALVVLKRARPDDRVGPIFYTFCQDTTKVINWKALHEKQSEQAASPDELKDKHKHALSERLVSYFENTLKIGDAAVGRDVPGARENIYISNEHSLTVVRGLDQQIRFNEIDNTAAHNLAERRVVDQDSRLQLVVDKGFCSSSSVSCAELVADYLVVSLDGKDKNGNPIKKEVELERNGQAATLKIALDEFLGQTVKITAWYRNNGNDLKIHEIPSVKVENLGLVMTFPVISEIVTLAGKSKASEASVGDIKFQSSIPVSFAYNLSAGDGRHVAVTFPWMVGWNPRSAPNLADIIKVFPHVSFIFPVNDDAKNGTGGDAEEKVRAQVALGAGVAFVNAFTISWGMATDTGAHYALLGVSIPELIETMNW